MAISQELENFCLARTGSTAAGVELAALLNSGVVGDTQTFAGITGANEIVVPTNLADALSIKDSASDIIVINTTTGAASVKFVAAKLGFFNATPVVQQAAAAQGALGGTLTGTTNDTLVDVAGSWDATAIAAINKNFKDVQELVNALRTALVNVGIIKGSA